MPDVSGRGVFLSYRREDAGPYARMLQRELTQHFPKTRVFMDLDSIAGGTDFAKVIRDAIGSSAVLVALIGPRWARFDPEPGAGGPRLYDPKDFVQLEVRTALALRLRVIPVLVDGAAASAGPAAC